MNKQQKLNWIILILWLLLALQNLTIGIISENKSTFFMAGFFLGGAIIMFADNIFIINSYENLVKQGRELVNYQSRLIRSLKDELFLKNFKQNEKPKRKKN
jgi:hypothetical protein